MIARRRCPGWVVHAFTRVGILNAHFCLESVRVPEEETENVAEVGHEPVRRAAGEQALADLVECSDGCGLEREMVEPTSPEHGRLALVLIVAGELEDVQLRRRPDPDERQPESIALLEDLVRGTEDALVELEEALGVAGQYGDVIESVQQHGRILPRCVDAICRATTAVLTEGTNRETAHQVAQGISDLPPVETAVTLVEDLATTRSPVMAEH